MRRIIKWRRDGPPKCSFGPHCPTEQYSKNFWSEEGSPRNSLKTLPPPVFPLNFSDEKSVKNFRFSESWAKMEPKVSNRNHLLRREARKKQLLLTLYCSSTEHCAEKGKEEAPEKQKQQQHSPETANGTRQASYESK